MASKELIQTLGCGEIKSSKYKYTSVEKDLKRLQDSGEDFFVRRGSEIVELIYAGVHHIYNSKSGNFPANSIFLFGLVSKDARKFIAENPFINIPQFKETKQYNLHYDDSYGKLVGTDLNHAYWRLAYVKGYISKRTYEKGLEDRCKQIRNASISILGRTKSFQKYEKGKMIQDIETQKEDKLLKMIFKDIRHTCFAIMNELAIMLGNDFDSYKTDCIYYRDTPENRKLVEDYLDQYNLVYKHLVYNSMDSFEKIETPKTLKNGTSKDADSNNKTKGKGNTGNKPRR